MFLDPAWLCLRKLLPKTGLSKFPPRAETQNKSATRGWPGGKLKVAPPVGKPKTVNYEMHVRPPIFNYLFRVMSIQGPTPALVWDANKVGVHPVLVWDANYT